MNFGRILFLAALAALIFSGLPSQAAPPAPSPWLAAVTESGGMLGGEWLVINSVPKLIVYADGTAVWRTGTVSRDALKQFRATVQANNYFTIHPQPVAPPADGGMVAGVRVSDGTTTQVAVQFGGAEARGERVCAGCYGADGQR